MKPRRWFQLHLTTCILLMLAAGLLLKENVMTDASAGKGSFSVNVATNTREIGDYYSWDLYGWPEPFMGIEQPENKLNIEWEKFFPNVLAWALILLPLTLTSEIILRLRSKRREKITPDSEYQAPNSNLSPTPAKGTPK